MHCVTIAVQLLVCMIKRNTACKSGLLETQKRLRLLLYLTMVFFVCFAVLLKNVKKEEEKPFRDCADVYQSGFNKSGVYTIYINNVSDPKKVNICFIFLFVNMMLLGFKGILEPLLK